MTAAAAENCVACNRPLGGLRYWIAGKGPLCPPCRLRELEPYQTYEIDQPWIIYTYLVPDSQIPAEGGSTRIRCTCAICGEEKDLTLTVPPLGTPDPPAGYRHAARSAFLAAHVHKLQQRAPETWAKPLLNPAAHNETLDILRDVAEKVRRQVPPTEDTAEGGEGTS